jgi:putative phosphoesterase
MYRVGLISDTHGLLRPEAQAFLQGSDYIIHGGDIGSAQILDQLSAIAPVTAVRGNNDTDDAWAGSVPETQFLQVGDVGIYVLHDLARLDIDPAAAARVIVSGHSHKPSAQQKQGVLYVNPGSAGRRRFKLPIAIGELLIDGASVAARILELRDCKFEVQQQVRAA